MSIGVSAAKLMSMTTALATGSGLPDVMAIDLRYIGKFAGSGGYVDLNQAPYLAASHADDYVRFAMAQGAGPGGTQVAIPADIGPGTLIYRKDLLDRAGVSEAEITRDWSAYLSAGERLRKATGAYLMADAADLRDIALRQGLRDGEGLYFDADGRVLVDESRIVGRSTEAFGEALRERSQLGGELLACHAGLHARDERQSEVPDLDLARDDVAHPQQASLGREGEVLGHDAEHRAHRA